jgi:hypothetical protein
VKHQYLKCLINSSTEHEELDGGGNIYLGWPQVVGYLGWRQVVYLSWPPCTSCVGMVKYLKCLVNTSAEHKEMDGEGEVYLRCPQEEYLGWSQEVYRYLGWLHVSLA